ncbi:MAG: SPOR domain-containing protein [Magnetococcales bacterium]|nr:SPOR domain-containing protein [Magnetococcales bacterium]
MRLIFLLFMLLWVANPAEAIANNKTDGYQLTIITEPSHAKVTILNTTTEYSPGVVLPSGRYNILVTAPGYLEEKGYIEIQDKEWVGRVVLQKSANHDDPELTAIDLEWQRINTEKLDLQKAQSQLVAERLVFDQQKVEFEKQKKKLIMQQIELAKAQYEVDAQRLEISEKLNRLERLDKSNTEFEETKQPPELVTNKSQLVTKSVAKRAKQLAKSEEQSEDKEVSLTQQSINKKKAIKQEVEKLKKKSVLKAAKKLAVSVTKKVEKSTSNQQKVEVPRAVITEKQFIHLVNNSRAKAPPANIEPPDTNPKEAKNPEIQKLLTATMAGLRLYQPKKMAKKLNRGLKKKVDRLKALAPDDPKVKQITRLYKARYIVVVGLFAKKNRAMDLVKKLKKQDFSAYYEQADLKSGRYYRVAVGPFEKRSQGIAVKKLLYDNLKIKDTILRVFKN